MGFLNDNIPADTEAVRLGASRIRGLQTRLNTVLAKIFDSAGNFLTGWVLPGHLAANSVVAGNLAPASVSSDNLIDHIVTSSKLASQAVGNYELALGSVSASNLTAGCVSASSLAANSVGAANLIAGSVGLAALGSGVVGGAMGTYSGSSQFARVIDTLAFAPTVVLIIQHGAVGFGVAILGEAVGGIGPIHLNSGLMAAPVTTAITWGTNGFTVAVCPGVNQASGTYYYLALRV